MKLSHYLVFLLMTPCISCQKEPESANEHEPVENQAGNQGVSISKKFRQVEFGEESDFIENLTQQTGPNQTTRKPTDIDE
jgi:hypothetical protein